MNITRVLTFAFPLLVAGLLGCSGEKNDAQNAAPESSRAESARQPAVSGPPSFTLLDPAGTIHQAHEWIGRKPVVINFWGTWCPPCRKEIPDMVRVYEEYKDRVEILGIALNDTPEKVVEYARQSGMNWVLLMGDPQIAMMFGIQGVPTTFFLDAQGNVVEVEDTDGNMANHFVGPRDYATFKRALDTIIRESNRSS